MAKSLEDDVAYELLPNEYLLIIIIMLLFSSLRGYKQAVEEYL